MNKSIKLSLISLLWLTTLPMMGIEEEQARATENSAAEQAKKLARENDIQERLQKHNLFFHSDRVENLQDARITMHDNTSISGLRRWWSHQFTKGDIARVEDAFNKRESFDKFTKSEKQAFKNLNDDDKATLIREYLQNLKKYFAKQQSIAEISYQNTETKINSEIKKLTEEKDALEAEIAALKKEKWNFYRLKHVFKNDDERSNLQQTFEEQLENKKIELGEKYSELNTEKRSNINKQKELIDKFDTQVQKFMEQINPLLNNMQLRFDIKTNTFEIHNTSDPLKPQMLTTTAANAAAAAAGGGSENTQEQAQQRRAAEKSRELEEEGRLAKQATMNPAASLQYLQKYGQLLPTTGIVVNNNDSQNSNESAQSAPPLGYTRTN